MYPNTHRIAREHGALANVLQAKEQQHDAFKANAATSMRQRAVTERVHVRLRDHKMHNSMAASCDR